MLSSKVFKSHLGVWTSEGASLKHILPRYEEKRDYLRFGKDRDILATSKKGPGVQELEVQDPSTDYKLDDTIDSEVRELFVGAR